MKAGNRPRHYTTLLRSYGNAIQNYGIVKGTAEGSDDPEGWRKELATWARKARDAASMLALANPGTIEWQGEVEYWEECLKKVSDG